MLQSKGTLKRYCIPATASYFMKFYFVKWSTFQKYGFLNKPQVKSGSKVMPVFVFYLWHHLWQTFRTAANFLYNSSLSRNTRFLISGQVFNQSLWKLIQIEITYSKTLKLQNFCEMHSERCETGVPGWRHFPKFLKTVSK